MGNPCLVPERHAGHQVRALPERRFHGTVRVIGPAFMFDLEPQGLRERDGIGQVPAIGGHPRAQVRAIGHRHPVEGPVVHMQPPGVVEIVLRASPLDRGPRFAVHPEMVIAFTKPACLRLHDRKHRADVMAPAFYLEEFVGRAVRRRRQSLAIAGVEIQRVFRQRGDPLPVHVIIKIGRSAPPFIGDRDFAGPAEGHRPIAVPRPPL